MAQINPIYNKLVLLFLCVFFLSFFFGFFGDREMRDTREFLMSMIPFSVELHMGWIFKKLKENVFKSVFLK